MRSLFGSLLASFLTTPGLVVLAALDSSLIFFLPLGIDFVLILLADCGSGGGSSGPGIYVIPGGGGK